MFMLCIIKQLFKYAEGLLVKTIRLKLAICRTKIWRIGSNSFWIIVQSLLLAAQSKKARRRATLTAPGILNSRRPNQLTACLLRWCLLPLPNVWACATTSCSVSLTNHLRYDFAHQLFRLGCNKECFWIWHDLIVGITKLLKVLT